MSNIIINNKEYNNVPSITFNKVGGGTATYTEGGGTTILTMVLRPDAEVVKTYSYDKLLVANESITLPSYTTSATVFVSSEDLATYTCDFNTYDYYILERSLTTPVYNTATPAKGRQEYHYSSYAYEVSSIPPNTYKSASGVLYATRDTNVFAAGSYYRLLYWSSSSAIKTYSTAGYGFYQSIVAPTISNGVITPKSTNVGIRSSSAYLPSAVYSTITDVRRQYIIEIWRAPKDNLNINGFTIENQAMHVIDCVNNNNGKLT